MRFMNPDDFDFDVDDQEFLDALRERGLDYNSIEEFFEDQNAFDPLDGMD